MGTIAQPPSGQPGPMQPGDFTPAGPATIVSWQLKRLPPPSPLYVTTDDVLRCSAATSQAQEVVTVNYRLLRAQDAKLVFGQFTVSPSTSRAALSKGVPLTEGFLLSVSLSAAVATTRGQTFVRLILNPSALGVGQPAQMLASDYVTTAMAPGYPNGRQLSPVEGPGFLRALTITGISAGHDWTISMPSNTRWRVQTIYAVLSTSGTAGNRLPQLFFGIGANNVDQIPAPAAIPASTLAQISWQAGGSVESDTEPSYNSPLPNNLIIASQASANIASNTVGIQAADQWASVSIWVEEWLDNV